MNHDNPNQFKSELKVDRIKNRRILSKNHQSNIEFNFNFGLDCKYSYEDIKSRLDYKSRSKKGNLQHGLIVLNNDPIKKLDERVYQSHILQNQNNLKSEKQKGKRCNYGYANNNIINEVGFNPTTSDGGGGISSSLITSQS